MCCATMIGKSSIVDEPLHVFAGYTYLKWGDFRANPEHPPLAKMWAALPLLALDIKDPRAARPYWDLITANPHGFPLTNLADDMLFVDNDGEQLFLLAKLQMVLIGVLLGGFVFLWSKELFGRGAGAASLALYALDPNILAHSQIIHTDMPFAAFFFIGTYFFWRVLRRRVWPNIAAAACCFGLAALTKYSYPVVLLSWALVAALIDLAARRGGARTPVLSAPGLSRLGGMLSVVALIAYAVIWAGYGFRFDAIPGNPGALAFAASNPSKGLLYRAAGFVYEHRLFPEAWIYGQLDQIGRLADLKEPMYFLGRASENGFWLYFPVAFMVKTPVPSLILLSLGLWLLAAGRLDR